jgi:PAS domain S-box-containing protein
MIQTTLVSNQPTTIESLCSCGKTFSATIAPVIEENYVNVYGQDITDRKQARDNLQLERDNLTSILDSMKDGVYIVDQDHNIRYINPTLKKTFGSVEDRKCYRYFHERQEPCSWCKNKEVFAGQTVQWEWYSPKMGRTYDLLDSPLTLSDGTIGKLEIFRDITDRKQASEQLKKAKEQAETANIAKSHFLANMSHEIRTPMSVILGFSELLASGNMSKKQSDHLNLIRDAGKGLLQVINDVLDVSKIESGKLDINMTDCSLNKIIEKIGSMMRPMAMEKGLEFKVVKNENLPAMIYTDSNRLDQCLINLIRNAIKFTEKGHVHLKVSLDSKNSSLIRFDIEDTGIGIEPDKLQSVFESFTQIDNTYVRQQTGTGLGLTITKSLTELLGGTISVTSKPGIGSVFSLVIPAGVDLLAQAQIEQEPATQLSPFDANRRQFNGKVLIAEDYEGLREYAKLLLESFGLKTVLVVDGQQAVEKALSDSFDLILMDLRMPNMDGYQAVKELRDKDNTTPIIAVTAHAVRGYKEICLSKGFDDYISKPINNEELTEILAKYLPLEEKA